MRLNVAGELVVSWWRSLPDKFPSASADSFVVMPNHFHRIIVIEAKGQTHRSAPTGALEIMPADARVRPYAPISQMVQWFKTMTTNAYIHSVKESGWAPFAGRLWQRNYYEHVIRDSADHERVHGYIESNPAQWALDDENPLKP
jgi:REP element-mobilizing transposase RayT